MDEPSPLDTFSFRSCHNNNMWPLAVQAVLFTQPPSFFLPTTCHRRIGHQSKSPGADLNHFNRRCFDSINFYPDPAQARIFPTTYIRLDWKVSAAVAKRKDIEENSQPARERFSNWLLQREHLPQICRLCQIDRKITSHTTQGEYGSKEIPIEDLWDRPTDLTRPKTTFRKRRRPQIDIFN